MPLFTNYGKPKATIANYMKGIEQSYIPSLNQALDTNINNYPKLTRETYAVYEDPDQGVDVEISSNHRDITEKGDLFVAVSYDGMKEDAGIINLNNIQDAVNITQYSLQELGFKTPEDKEREAQEAELQKQKEVEQKRRVEERKAKKREEWKRQQEEPEPEEEEPVETEPEDDSYDEEKEEYVDDLNKRLKFLSNMDEASKIELEWLVLPQNNLSNKEKMEFAHVQMNLTHVSGENFLVETQKIKPKIEAITDIKGAIDYANKVSDKVRAVPQIMMKDENGKDLKLPIDMSDEEFNDDDFALDI